jgi:colicin import membrane protein
MNRPVLLRLKNGDIRPMVCISAIVHVAVFLILLEFHFPSRFKEAPVYYVDILDLPVANPQAGTPSRAEHPQSSPPSPPPAPREMTLPVKPAPKKPAVAPPKKTEPAETAEEFNKRLANIEKKAADERFKNVMKNLSNKGAQKGPVGMPGATGTEAGSDYASYIRSRLEDEFRATIAFQSKKPEVLVKLTISRYGRVIRQQIVKSTRDRIFEDAVARAIVNTEQHLRPPPSGTQFEITVKFSPQGIGNQ